MQNSKIIKSDEKSKNKINIIKTEIKEEPIQFIKESYEEIEDESSEESGSDFDESSNSNDSDSDNDSDDEEGSQKKKRRKTDEHEEKIIDNQFHDIKLFEKNDSFLGSIISS